MGYHRAGFTEIIGIDHKPMPRYPFEFVQADVFEWCAENDLSQFDLIHASPPCQAYSQQTPPEHRGNHPRLIEKTRKVLVGVNADYVIENVQNARKHLLCPVKLCGSMFGLKFWRHRYFECSFTVQLTPPCCHNFEPVMITGTTRRKPERGGRFEYTAQECRDAHDLQWMTRAELDEAIPPAYTEWIGRQFIRHLEHDRGRR